MITGYFLIAVVSLLIILYVIVCIHLSLYKNRKERRRRIADQYDELLCSYLSPSETLVEYEFPGIEKKFNRRVLISRIQSLISNLHGIESKILLLIFRSNCLSNELLEKYARGGTYRSLEMLSIFREVPAPASTMFMIGRYMCSKNQDVRMFALLALFNHDNKKIIPGLRNYSYPLCMRDYANIWSFISRRSISFRNAELLLTSKNKSVCAFGQKLTAFYGLKV